VIIGRKNIFRRLWRSERGQAFNLVLIMLLLGTAMLPPLLSLSATGSKMVVGQSTNTRELYAADAGVEDALWQLKYNNLSWMFSEPVYDRYDYVTVWDYNLDEPVNGQDVNVAFENTWIPKGITAPDAATGRDIIETGKLIVTGSNPTETGSQIKMDFYPDAGDALTVDAIGVWLPPGFNYVADSGNLEADQFAVYYSEPVISAHQGGQAVVWSFVSLPYTDLPGVGAESPQVATITFSFSASEAGSLPDTISWIDTGGVAGLPFSWDDDRRIYHITSAAGDTTVEAYSIKSELRELGSTIAGDYRAVGNSLMLDLIPDGGGPMRDTLLASSDATVSDLPGDAEVIAAYLYWSAWVDSEQMETVYFYEYCGNYSDWLPHGDWGLVSGQFVGHHNGADVNRSLTLQTVTDLSGLASGEGKVCWNQSEAGYLETGDGLKFAFSGDGGSTWSDYYTAFINDNPPSSFSYEIPDAYLTDAFTFKFYLHGFDGSGEYVYLDNFCIYQPTETAADLEATFAINGQQVYYDALGEPASGNATLVAGEWSVLENNPNEYSYSCLRDVTTLVRAYSDLGDGENRTGNAVYTVGDVYGDLDNKWAYAGWSLIIIYACSTTQGHQLYLYDDFAYCDEYENVDFDGDGQPGGTIDGFIVPEPIAGETNAAGLTCFVGEGDDAYSGDNLVFNGTVLWDGSDGASLNNAWNGKSVGLTADGVDVDTFDVTWASGLLQPGDTSAQVDLATQSDSWNLIYIILSFRSETSVGGTVTYLISH
jgi:hypothetical protein